MKVAHSVSAFAAYQKHKSTGNNVSKKKRRNEKRKILLSVLNSSVVSVNGVGKTATKGAKKKQKPNNTGFQQKIEKVGIEKGAEKKKKKKRRSSFTGNDDGAKEGEQEVKNGVGKEIAKDRDSVQIKKKKLSQNLQPIVGNGSAKEVEEQSRDGDKKEMAQMQRNFEKIKKKKKANQNLQPTLVNGETLEDSVFSNGLEEQSGRGSKKQTAPKERSSEKTKKTRTDQKLPENRGSVDVSPFSNSLENAQELFQWLLAPTKPADFYREYWEKKPLHIKRPENRDHFKHLFSSEDLDTMLRENALFYTRNLDVVTYVEGKRETHNPAEIRATPSAVWDYYSNECSVRVLNPHTYNEKVHLLLATLQEYFGNTMGANVYLTPAGSQGFAPHWDDIEAFVLQVEGRKHWKLYGPKNKNQVLARHSSHNLTPDELGPLKHSVTVEAGDVLYFPRGTIHEASTDKDSHSLHITVSVYQNTCFADLLEKALPEALKKAAAVDVDFRKGLPLRFLTNVGVGAKKNQEQQQKIQSTVKNLMTKLIEHVDVNNAADQLGRKFMYDSLPPVLTNEEKLHSVRNDGEFLFDGKVFNRIEFQPDTEVRLLRQFCLRVVLEGKEAKIYYNTENSRLYHGEEEQFLEIDLGLVPAVSHLLRSFPGFVAVEDLPIADDDLKLQIVSDLWERGLVVTKERLECIDDEEEDED